MVRRVAFCTLRRIRYSSFEASRSFALRVRTLTGKSKMRLAGMTVVFWVRYGEGQLNNSQINYSLKLCEWVRDGEKKVRELETLFDQIRRIQLMM